MAKKSRRARRQLARTAEPVRISRPTRPEAAQVAARDVDFVKEYHYVIEDLKRIAITALGLLILLIVLAIVVG